MAVYLRIRPFSKEELCDNMDQVQSCCHVQDGSRRVDVSLMRLLVTVDTPPSPPSPNLQLPPVAPKL